MNIRLLITSALALFAATTTIRGAEAQELQLPQIPDSIVDPMLRADYLAAHFWDNFDPLSPLAADTADLEQAFATYAWIQMSTDDQDQAQSAMANLMSRSAANPQAYKLLCQNAKKYFYQSDSPSENLLAYRNFLQSISQDSVLDMAERERNKYTLESIEAVFPGKKAPGLTLADGRELGESIPTPFCLLVFYDHDCEECQQLLATIEKSAYLNMIINDGTASVLLVDVADDNTDPRADDYLMRSVPSIYLLQQDCTIMLPDTTLNKALAMIAACSLAANANTIGF